MKKLATIIAASGLALGLSACGSPEKDAEQAVTDFAQAFEDKDYDKVCDSIDPEMLKTMESAGTTCVEGMKEGGDDLAEEANADDIEILSSTVSEDEKTATVKVKNSKDEENDVKLVKVEDEWKITMQ
ncbi:DUF4878 domain-containing protein [Janibacter terrae]|jgi:ABC-type glycerol-3-phosphate transport system substrate-binding protein|uniref:DUF4878 domain-containing protein n=1 Tax=Janibacter terrae TaxID=103817 RepID=A0ABZ2FCD0_9MICO|nr:DUF4878 domain-containing protein [Janibacter terrae]MBA4084960.1 DUF4878 domain-containing protein [Kytococcus sp.]HCE60977.1 DUF4878 domain-containing protein [Janibacter terrae]